MNVALDQDLVLDVLRQVSDPEAGMNIVDLGLVYGITIDGPQVRITMTMTSAACPMAEMLVDDVLRALAAALPEETEVDVELVWDPPWTPDRMSEVARTHFGWDAR
jgi:metal-sulfur cluster biosynthetic enzyme